MKVAVIGSTDLLQWASENPGALAEAIRAGLETRPPETIVESADFEKHSNGTVRINQRGRTKKGQRR